MTLCFLSVCQHFIHFIIFALIPLATIVSICLRCGNFSNALAKSMYNVLTGTHLSISDVTCSRLTIRLVRMIYQLRSHVDCIWFEMHGNDIFNEVRCLGRYLPRRLLIFVFIWVLHNYAALQSSDTIPTSSNFLNIMHNGKLISYDNAFGILVCITPSILKRFVIF